MLVEVEFEDIRAKLIAYATAKRKLAEDNAGRARQQIALAGAIERAVTFAKTEVVTEKQMALLLRVADPYRAGQEAEDASAILAAFWPVKAGAAPDPSALQSFGDALRQQMTETAAAGRGEHP